MRRLIASLAAMTALAAGLVAPASAGPTIGGFASDNIEYVKTIPLHVDSAGGALVGKYFYITTERDLTIYDVSDPVNPEQVGHLVYQSPGTFYFPEEDPETNGRVLLVSNGGGLQVIDVEDKTNPQVIGEVDGANEHTISCVLDCKWAYGSEGVIVDLRNPAKPKIAGDWAKGAGVQSTHDVTEVAPGWIMTSSQPLVLLDARKNPAKPKVVSVIGHKDQRFNHSNLWPRGMKDRFLLVGGEATGPGCSEEPSATFMTYDTTDWRTRGFRLVDEYRLSNGLPHEGQAPTEQFCVHWFDTHPNYRNGGLVSIAWYEHGSRVLKISDAGKVSEIGWFVPFAGSTSATYWVTDEVLYAADYNRGLDILRYTGKS